MGEIVPGVATLAIVFPNRAPLSFAEVRAPHFPRSNLQLGFVQALVFRRHCLAPSCFFPGAARRDSAVLGEAARTPVNCLAMVFGSTWKQTLRSWLRTALLLSRIHATLLSIIVPVFPTSCQRRWKSLSTYSKVAFVSRIAPGFCPIRFIRAKNTVQFVSRFNSGVTPEPMEATAFLDFVAECISQRLRFTAWQSALSRRRLSSCCLSAPQ